MSINIKQLFEDNSIDVKTSGSQISKGWLAIRCPFCGDSGYHLGWNDKINVFSCWKCGRHNTKKVLMNILKIPYSEIEKVIKNYGVIDSDEEIKVRKNIDEIVLPENEGCFRAAHKKYLLSRGFNHKEISSRYNAIGTGSKGRLKDRILIPINYKKKTVSYMARDITGEHNLKVMACPEHEEAIHYKDLIYNFDNIPGNTIIVSEGIFDAWRWGEIGTAIFGIIFTENQLELLSCFKNIFIVFDSNVYDEDGKLVKNEKRATEQAERLADNLSLYSNVWVIDDLGSDPADMTQFKANSIKRRLVKLAEEKS